jgi:cold shock CspA family protein
VAVGSVVRFDRRRGYGFVAPDDGGEDVFVHQNNITMEGFRYLQVGERVNYELEVGEKGMKAVSVSLVEPRQERPRGEGGFDDYGDQRDERDNPRPSFQDRAPRDFDRPQRDFERPARPAPRAFAAPTDDGQLEKLRRKQERLISLLVAKGVLAPGEIDGLESAVASAGNGQA